MIDIISRIMMIDNIEQGSNETNFLLSGPFMDLPAYHPTRIVNILFGTSYMVVVPFVYFSIFRSVMMTIYLMLMITMITMIMM